MANHPDLNLELKPKLISSIFAGFETVANHLELIIIPVVLDLFLWFGPHVRINNIVQPLINGLILPVSLQNKEFEQVFTTTRELYILIAERFNVFSAFRTLPVGIPSLMNNISPIINPIGSPLILEVKNFSSAFMMWLVIGLVGLIVASFFYNAVCQAVSSEKAKLTPGSIGWQTLQLLYLTILSILFILVIVFPAMMIVSFLSLLTPILGQIALFAGGLLLIWIITPMLFAPQVIFMQHQSALKAILASIRMVRFALPTTGLFFLVVLLLSQGLVLLWQIPGEKSWFTLIGLAGNAIVNTSLLAAIFIYYRDAVKWIQSIISKNNLSQAFPVEGPKNV
jgi:hypothetical protein